MAVAVCCCLNAVVSRDLNIRNCCSSLVFHRSAERHCDNLKAFYCFFQSCRCVINCLLGCRRVIQHLLRFFHSLRKLGPGICTVVYFISSAVCIYQLVKLCLMSCGFFNYKVVKNEILISAEICRSAAGALCICRRVGRIDTDPGLVARFSGQPECKCLRLSVLKIRCLKLVQLNIVSAVLAVSYCKRIGVLRSHLVLEADVICLAFLKTIVLRDRLIDQVIISRKPVCLDRPVSVQYIVKLLHSVPARLCIRLVLLGKMRPVVCDTLCISDHERE